MGSVTDIIALTFDRWLESSDIDISTKCHNYEISNKILMV